MLKLVLLSAATLAAYAQEPGASIFSIQTDGSAKFAGGFSAPSIVATTTLMVGESNVASTFETNAAERAAMQQTIDKLEADSAANQIAEQEQNSRVDKMEADAATNAATDVELTDRVSKAEAEAQMAAKAEEEQNAKLEESEKSWVEKMAAQEASFNEKFASMEAKHKADSDSQQKVLDQLVKIMSRFDVSGELESLRQANQPAAAGEE